MEIHVTATECHLPCGITQCYLSPYTSKHTPPSPQPYRLVLVVGNDKEMLLIRVKRQVDPCTRDTILNDKLRKCNAKAAMWTF